MAKVVTSTTLAQDINEAISFGELLESRHPNECQLLRRAIYQAACTVIADQLAAGDPGVALSVSRHASSPNAGSSGSCDPFADGFTS